MSAEFGLHAIRHPEGDLLAPYRTADGRTVMASGVYPHLAAKWCRFLDVPPDYQKVSAAFATRAAFELEESANAAGLPLCVARTPRNGWPTHRARCWPRSR